MSVLPSTPALSLPFGRVQGDKVFLLPQALQIFQTQVEALIGSGGIADQVLLNSAKPNIQQIGSSSVSWTPTVAGSTTPGAQTYSSQIGLTVEAGPLRIAMFSITMTAKDGATAGNVTIAGLPQAASASLIQAGWLSSWGGVTVSAGVTQLGVQMAPSLDVASIMQSGSTLAAAPLTAAGLSATSSFVGGVLYFR